MDVGIYVALSKELGVMRDMEVTSNDLANVTTNGYDSEAVLFKDFLVGNTTQEGHVDFSNDIATYRDTSEGDMHMTGSPLDAAIQGSGYFVVQTALGQRYTRNGSFKISGAGLLVTAEGFPVLDESDQPISFDEADRVIQIKDDGTISVDGGDRTKLKIAQFDNEQLLERTGSTLYKTDAKPKVADNYSITSGMLEGSNVKPVLALTHMIYVSRSISETATYMSTIDTLSQKASDTLSKVYS